jgi:sulfur carrier protein ThiS
MRVRVNLLPTRKETKLLVLDDGSTVERMIRSIGLFPDGWIAVKDSEPLPLDERLEDEDEIDLISVVSGG